MLKKLLKSNFFLVLAFLFLFLRLPSLFEPYWYDDEGIYLTIGQALNRGVSLYNQIHDNKPPLIYLMAAFSKNVFGFRLLLFFIMIPTVFLFYKFAKNFLPQKLLKFATVIFVIFSSIPLIEGNIANAEIFMLLPTLAAFFIYIKASKSLHYFISGLLLGLSFMIKAPAAVEFGTIFLWEICHLFDKKILKKDIFFFVQKCLLLLFGFLTPLVFCSIYFLAKGGFNYFIYASVLQNFGYLSSWDTGAHTGPALGGGLLSRLLILMFILAITYLSKRTKKINNNNFMVISWFAFSLFGALLSGRPYPHYFIEILPPFIILLSYIIDKNRIYLKFLVILCVILLLAAVVKYKFYFYRTFSYYTNFYSFVLKHKSKDEFNNFFGWQVSENYQISEYISNNSISSDRIFVWGDRASIYALSNRLPVGRFTTAYHIIDFNGYKETYENFKVHMPKIIVYFPMPGREFPDLDLLIQKYYYLVVKIGNALIFQPR